MRINHHDKSQRAVAAALDQTLLKAIKPLTASLIGIYVVFGTSKDWVLALLHGKGTALLPWLIGTDLLAATACLGIYVLLHHLPLSPRMAHPIGALLLGIALADTMTHMILQGNPAETITFVLIACGVSIFVLSPPYFVGSIAAVTVTWGIAALYIDRSGVLALEPTWVECGVSLVQGITLSVAVFLTRLGTYRRLEHLRMVDQSRSEALETALEEIRSSHSRLQELDRLKNDFVNAVTHELRTPLSSVVGYAELLQDEIGGSLSAAQHEFIRQIQLGSSRLENLLNDLLDFARIEAGSFRLRLSPADGCEKLREVIDSMRPLAEAARVNLRMSSPAPPMIQLMDAQRIGQVLINLISNAIKFTPAGGAVEARLRREEDSLVWEVEDSGEGIADADIPQLFKRFSQLSNGKRRGGGTGLGLAISKALVEAHGGSIGVHSTLGRGSTFWFRLPSLPVDTPWPTAPGEAAWPGGSPSVEHLG
jgi:signal transduction histidine kinase